MTDRATSQSDNWVPARRGEIWSQAVDTTARAYQISLMPFGGKPITNTKQVDHIYLDLHADGGDVYYYFDSASSTALDDTASNAVGVAVTATTMSGSAAFGARIPSGGTISVRIERSLDHWLTIKTASGTATLRVNASSQAEV